jgi:hypothetical protein
MSRYLLALSVAAVAAIAVVPAAPTHAAPVVQATAQKEPHPRIRASLRALKAARAELMAAPHDFGGHRADAVKAIDQAVQQLNLALTYDSK